MIKPLILGNKIFPVNLIQGPLAGYTCAALRALTWRYSKPAFTCTEMISCKALLINKSLLTRYRYTAKDPAEGPVCFQLFGDSPSELAEATKIVTDCGADLIDLNCGCPVKKVRRQGAGSSLLLEPQKLYHLIVAMKQNTHLPVSIKIRVEGGSQDKFNEEIIKIVCDAGADFLVVHGRHWNTSYKTPCNYEQIKFFVERMKIPVIGNGDIACIDSLKKMFTTGCAGVMIARACVGQPWLIGNLTAEMCNGKIFVPTAKEVGLVFIEHVERMINLLGNERAAVLHARSIAKHYARVLGARRRSAFCVEVNSCDNLLSLKEISSRYFG